MCTATAAMGAGSSGYSPKQATASNSRLWLTLTVARARGGASRLSSALRHRGHGAFRASPPCGDRA
eukprot:scaffold39973_cov33-Phaeocystis_antarctica.AAC.1